MSGWFSAPCPTHQSLQRSACRTSAQASSYQPITAVGGWWGGAAESEAPVALVLRLFVPLFHQASAMVDMGHQCFQATSWATMCATWRHAGQAGRCAHDRRRSQSHGIYSDRHSARAFSTQPTVTKAGMQHIFPILVNSSRWSQATIEVSPF